jgi:cation transport ATPase
MPTKKQRRRHQKARRHEYEYVYVDDEGNEVEVDPAEVRAEKETVRESRPAKASNQKAAVRTSSRRTIEPPSWRRSGKRALILGPLMVVAMMLFNQGLPLTQQIAPALFLIAFFIPFSYFTDSLAYKMFRKRLERQNTAKSR